MPVYSYRCSNCGNEFEVIQSMTEKKLRKCNRCMQKKLERVINPSSIHFKADGFTKKLR